MRGIRFAFIMQEGMRFVNAFPGEKSAKHA